MVLDFIKTSKKMKKVNLCRFHKISMLAQKNLHLTMLHNKSARRLITNESFYKYAMFYFRKYADNTCNTPQIKSALSQNINAGFSNNNYYTAESYFRSHSFPLLGSNLSSNIYSLSVNTSDKQVLSILDTSWESEHDSENREKTILNNLSVVSIRYRKTFARKRRNVAKKSKITKYGSFYKYYYNHKKSKWSKKVYGKRNVLKKLRMRLRKKLFILRLRNQKLKKKKQNKTFKQKNIYETNSSVKILQRNNFSLNALLNFKKRKKEPIIQFINSGYNNKLLKNILINPHQIVSRKFFSFILSRSFLFSPFDSYVKNKTKSNNKNYKKSSYYLVEAKSILLKKNARFNHKLITKLSMKKSYIFFNKTVRFLRKIKLLKTLKLKNYNIFVNKYTKQKLRRVISVNNYTLSKTKTKWKHSNPYLFLNNKNLTQRSSITLLDSYLHQNLSNLTYSKIRSTTSQFSFWKKKKNFLKKTTRFLPNKTLRYANLKTLGNIYNNPYNKLKVFTKQTHRFSYKNKKIKKQSNFKTNKVLHKKQIQSLFYLGKNKRRSFKIKKVLLKYNLPFSLTNYKRLSQNSFSFQSVFPKRTNFVKKLTYKKSYFFYQPQKSIGLKLLCFIPKINFSKIKKISPLELKTRSNHYFILKTPIMFFTQFFLKNKNKFYVPKFTFKKKIFSFLKLNEARQSLLDKKKQIFLYKTIFNQSRSFLKNSFYCPSNLKKFYIHSQNYILKNSNYLNSKLFSGNSSQFTQTYSTNDVVDNNIFDLHGINQVFQREEVRIPRVRFKPGYQRIWRNSRLALKEALQVKFVYQQTLTKYVSKFFRTSNYYAFSSSEMNISSTIIYSRLLPDLPTLQIFYNQHLVYLNGQRIISPSVNVYENDVIQLIVSKWYYTVYKWITNWTLKRVKRYKRLIYKKGLSGKYKLMKQKKQKSFHTPKWIYLTKYDSYDVKSYLEVDYLTLSAVIVYNPYILEYHSPLEVSTYRPTVYRLYNWKYIT